MKRLLGQLNEPVFLSAVASAIGVFRHVLNTQHRGWVRPLSSLLIGIALAASVADVLTPEEYPSVALLIGLVAGGIGARALDTLQELTPEAIKKLVNGMVDKVLGERKTEEGGEQ